MDGLKELIQELAKTSDEIYAKVCKVISVDAEEKTADLEPVDGSAVIDEVYIMTDHENGGLYLEPVVGSLITVVFVNKETALMVSSSALKQFQIKIESTELQVDKDGLYLKRENETLKALVNDLLEAIKKMKFTTNTGSTIKLVNITDFINIQNRFKTLLK